ncbi:type II toxin-antitoxin system VapC family toxin [Blastomonas sp. SL216]|uniref:type II toxin-antitoxin system VapC family toxin n=1 Tax=Blastomonas sp. SL216 TaxID=2995169 RepID=UPI0023779108|nr:type II toxin-antitoxin system VapC family toxin [Blastomonas sp. SL216]
MLTIPTWTWLFRVKPVRAVDTNILARWLLGDDPLQSAQAVQLLSEPAYVSLTVLTELGWVLEKALRLPRSVVGRMLEKVVSLEQLQVDKQPSVLWAIDRYHQGADWADMMHIVAASGAAPVFATFDRRIARDAGNASPVSVETLRKVP